MFVRASPSHLRGRSGVIRFSSAGAGVIAGELDRAVEQHEFRIAIPGALRSYTRQASQVTVALSQSSLPTLGAALCALDRAYPGIRFRIVDEQDHLRPHIQVFVDAAIERNLDAPLPLGARLMIVAALSGG